MEGGYDPWLQCLPTHPIFPLSLQEENTTSYSKSGPLFRTEVESIVVVKVPSGALSMGQKFSAPVRHPWGIVSPQVSNGVTTGPRPQRQNSFKRVERCRLRCLWGREVPGAYKEPKQQGHPAGTHGFSQSHCSSFSEQSGLWANLIMERRQGKLADWTLAQTLI